MKKKWLLLLLVLSPFLCWSGCYVWQNTKLPGPSGEVNVTYTISMILPDMPSANWSMDFSVSGYVEAIRFIPKEDGYVDLEVKTTKGWYFPRLQLLGRIDWEKGVAVTFQYPEGMALRKETSSFITMRHKFLGLEDRAGYAGSPLIPGDITGVQWTRKLWQKVDKSGEYLANEVNISRVYLVPSEKDKKIKVPKHLPQSHASGWAHNPSEIIEVLIFDHKVDAL